jgi:hypothetical protein
MHSICGMSNQLPTDIPAQMGADIVIGVDVTSPDLAYEEVDNVLNVVDQSRAFCESSRIGASTISD